MFHFQGTPATGLPLLLLHALNTTIQISMPEWLTGDVLDVRMAVMQWLSTQPPCAASNPNNSTRVCRVFRLSTMLSAHNSPSPISFSSITLLFENCF